MPLTSMAPMLRAAQAQHAAVGAFNVENMEMVQAVVDAAEKLRAPVILQTTPSTLRYAPCALFAAMAAACAARTSVPVALHLDHGDSLHLVEEALAAGYTSVMIDGSKLPLAENIALTRQAVRLAGAVPVEGELGRVGGKAGDCPQDGPGYTDPQEALRFVEETGVSALAIGVGTAHGVYAQAPKLNLPLITQLRKLLSVPLVLHGASGLTDAVLQDCVQRGVSKVNFATELRQAYSAAVRQTLREQPDAIDPKRYGAAGRLAVNAAATARMQLLGGAGRAGE